MGLINFGVPEKETMFLKEKLRLDVFVEGGTYQGGTAKKMSKFFRKVITIEKSVSMFETAQKNLDCIDNITMLKGDTREHLSEILDDNDNILFWLDAHWSGGETYGEEDECPLIDELEIIFRYQRNYVILIDDARLFLAPPPYPHKYKNWPSLKKIFNILSVNHEIIVFEDVIYIYETSINDTIIPFMQQEVTNRWKNNKIVGKESFMKRLRLMAKRLKNKKIHKI